MNREAAIPVAELVEELAPKRRFQPYPEYRDSGVKWLDSIPSHWETRRLKHVLACKITDGPHTTPTFLSDGVPFLSVDGIQNGELVFDGCRYVSEGDHHEYTRKAFPRQGDILLGKAASTGKIARVKVEFEFSIWSPLALIRVSKKHAFSPFVEYALKSPGVQAQIDVLCTSNTQKNISMDDIPLLAFALPGLNEQRAIAAFLDRETARIDELIANKQRLIELLAEKRTALISHAVTKGLNPDAPMKDSGIPWIGNVPTHWQVTRIKFLARVGNGSTPSREAPEYWNGWLPWLNSSVVNLTEVTEPVELVSDLALRECHLPRIRPPAVLVGITGEGKTRGMATLLRIEATINQHLAFVRPTTSDCMVEYVRYVLHSAYQFLRDESSGGGSTKGAITCEQLGNTAVPHPPAAEQEEIVRFIDEARAQLDALTLHSQNVIAHLHEYRLALVSAAVTGKIDVRNQIQKEASCQ